MKRKVRRSIDLALTILGIAIIFGTVMMGSTLGLQLQLMAVLVAVLLMEVGIWGLSSKVLPSDRRFDGLRGEADNILRLIRQLNSAAIAADAGTENDQRFKDTLEEMHSSVKQMAELASKANGSKQLV